MASNGLKLTDELADQFALAVSKGVPVETAARAAGIHPTTYYSWLRAARNGVWDTGDAVDEGSKAVLDRFQDLIVRAQAQWESHLIIRVTEAVDAVNEKTGLRDWRAPLTALQIHPTTRERYRQHREVVIDGQQTVTHEHRMVSGLEISELDALESEVKALVSPHND